MSRPANDAPRLRWEDARKADIQESVRAAYYCGGGQWLDGFDAYRSGQPCTAPDYADEPDDAPYWQRGWTNGWAAAEWLDMAGLVVADVGRK